MVCARRRVHEYTKYLYTLYAYIMLSTVHDLFTAAFPSGLH